MKIWVRQPGAGRGRGTVRPALPCRKLRSASLPERKREKKARPKRAWLVVNERAAGGS
jgi:hypothetical protein